MLILLTLWLLAAPIIINAKKPPDNTIDQFNTTLKNAVAPRRNLLIAGYSRWEQNYQCHSDYFCEKDGCYGACRTDKEPTICACNSSQCSACGKMQVSAEICKHKDDNRETVQEHWDIVKLLDPTKVVVFEQDTPCSKDHHCNDFNSCTIDTCELPYDTNSNPFYQCGFTPIDRSQCGTEVSVNYTANEFPVDFQWKIRNLDDNLIAIASNRYQNPHTFYDQSKCLQFGSYKFEVSYSVNNTFSSNVSYVVAVRKEVIVHDETYESYEEEEYL